MVWTPGPAWVVGDIIPASKLNSISTSLDEITDWIDAAETRLDSSWTTNGPTGSGPSIEYAYRRHYKMVDMRVRLVYSSAPSALNFTIASGMPSGVRPQSPGGFTQQGVPALCWGYVSTSNRESLAAFIATNGDVQVRNGATNPNSYVTFELGASYSIA